ncbi:MAG: hypothetical protein Kow00121_23550 [Elainellaceae cyanobacterium]
MLTDLSAAQPPQQTDARPQTTVALMPCGFLFEDFFDTVNISFETFRTELTGGWMFNYIDALKLAGIRTVLFFVSARVNAPWHFIHEPTGATVWVLPGPKRHREFRQFHRRIKLPGKRFINSLDAYLILPLTPLAELLQQENCQAILFQDYERPGFDLSVFLGRGLNLPVFATFQGGRPSRNPIEQLIRRVALRFCAGLVIASQTEIDRVKQDYHLPPAKIAQIFNPMDVMNWQSVDQTAARQALNLPLDARIVITHGRIDIVQKGLDILLQAWKQICTARPDQNLCLLLVGTGKDSPVLRQQIVELQLTNIVWVDEYVRDRTLLWQYISAADIYVLASRHEGFPVAPVEAMTCGLPVVAANAPGVADILAGGEASGGLIVPCEDSAALAQALERLLDDKTLRHQLGQRARQRAEAYFSLEAIGKQLSGFLNLTDSISHF